MKLLITVTTALLLSFPMVSFASSVSSEVNKVCLLYASAADEALMSNKNGVTHAEILNRTNLNDEDLKSTNDVVVREIVDRAYVYPPSLVDKYHDYYVFGTYKACVYAKTGIRLDM